VRVRIRREATVGGEESREERGEERGEEQRKGSRYEPSERGLDRVLHPMLCGAHQRRLPRPISHVGIGS